MVETIPPAQPRPPKPSVQQLVYTGKAGELFSIVLVNILLWIVTLSTHRFWGRTRVRRYLWSHMVFLEQPFAYLGTGMELFKGFLKFVLMFALPAILLSVIGTLFFSKSIPVTFAINALIGINFMIVFMYARFWGLRYRLGRTSWRGIRLEMHGRAHDFVLLQIKNYLINVISLGLYKPMADIAVLNFLVNRIHFGSLGLTYRGRPEELQKHYFLCWLLFFPTAGLSLFWYKAKYYSHIAKYTRLGAMEFRCKISGGELLLFVLVNLLIIIFTLGLGYSYTLHRRMQFLAQRFKFRGALDFEKIGQAGKRSGNEGAESYFGGDDIGF